MHPLNHILSSRKLNPINGPYTQQDCLYQYSLHSAYIRGALSSGPPVDLLPSYGTDALALTSLGERVLILDSKIYRLSNTGANETNAPPPKTPIAFAMITPFAPENRVFNPAGGDTIANLRETFAKGKHGYEGRNSPVAFAVKGAFRFVQTTTGRLEDVQGTVFGFVVPRWLESISGKGIGCCFLSGCHRRGGDVVDYLSIKGTFVEWATSDHFRVGLPRDGKFEGMDLFSDVTM